MKVLVDYFNQEKALVGAFSVIMKLQFLRRFVSSSTRLAFSAHSSILVAGRARPRQPRYATNDAGVEISVNFEML